MSDPTNRKSPKIRTPHASAEARSWRRKVPGNPTSEAVQPKDPACLDQNQPYEGTPDPGGPDTARRRSPEVNSMVNNLSLAEGARSNQLSTSYKRVAEDPPQNIKRSKYSNENIDSTLPLADVNVVSTSRFDRPPISTQPSALDTFVRQSHTVPLDDDVPTSPVDDDDGDTPEGDTSLLLQPDTKPITQEQLINEVKGIYAGLVMVEKKAVEITQARSKAANKLSNDQWQALIALHRTLLHEHHDFFLASQHPTASPALRRLAKKYAMPARMWRHGIHSFLELLRQQLPGSLEHMLAFVYIAYSMMALLMESVPSFLETWIECLGDLARYRMAIEEADLRDREIWSNVARTWYNKAADLSPNVGRIQHHLAVLARPNIVQQLFYYSKALVSVKPFENARESIMLLFNPLLDNEDTAFYDKYPTTEAAFVSAFATLFKRGSLQDYQPQIEIFQQGLSDHITRAAADWKTQGPEVAASMIAGVLDFGKNDNPIWTMYRQHIAMIESRKTSTESMQQVELDIEDADIRAVLFQEFWMDLDSKAPALPRAPGGISTEVGLDSSEVVTLYVLGALRSAIAVNANKIGDRNIVPFMSFVLGFLWSLARIGRPLIYLEAHIPWSNIVLFLNTLGRSGVSDERIAAATFPQSVSGTGLQLPEDFPARGAVWAQDIFPADFFRYNVTDEDERSLELPSHTAPRCERCLWLGVRLASLNRYIRYDVITKQFSVSDYALALEQGSPGDGHQSESIKVDTLAEKPHLPLENLRDVEMMDAQTSDARSLEADSDYVLIDRSSMAGSSAKHDKNSAGA